MKRAIVCMSLGYAPPLRPSGYCVRVRRRGPPGGPAGPSAGTASTRRIDLRPGPFAINCRNWWAPQLRNGDVVRWFYAEAATAPVHEHDIAAVAVRALCDEGHDGLEHVITGPASLTQREQVQIIGDAIGRPLGFEELSRESARKQMIAMMFPPPAADMLLDAYQAAVGQPALVTSTVLDVTGAPARPFRDWAMDHASDFATGG